MRSLPKHQSLNIAARGLIRTLWGFWIPVCMGMTTEVVLAYPSIAITVATWTNKRQGCRTGQDQGRCTAHILADRLNEHPVLN